eukprot:TRINITY_DN36288_c0_g1_i1.p2 TRINITY_DN36288_c0_g1~~TRINITY_DN36288_c0_g1_i1.p2  ORF type:complete len:188 (-),score=1.21 TRINITY_DN36288_c0_g1_i1:20-583(-)
MQGQELYRLLLFIRKIFTHIFKSVLTNEYIQSIYFSGIPDFVLIFKVNLKKSRIPTTTNKKGKIQPINYNLISKLIKNWQTKRQDYRYKESPKTFVQFRYSVPIDTDFLLLTQKIYFWLNMNVYKTQQAINNHIFRNFEVPPTVQSNESFDRHFGTINRQDQRCSIVPSNQIFHHYQISGFQMVPKE